MRNKFLIFLAITLIFISGCYAQNGTQSDKTANTPDTTTEDTGTSGGEIKEFTIRESSFMLSPSTITVNKGDTVRITVINDQGMHNLFIEGYNERTSTMSAGDSEVIEFVADEAGTFDMWCEVGSHRASGMEGTLVVM